MKGYSSREVIRILKNDGWYEVRIEGSHHHFRHQTKKRNSDGPASEQRLAAKDAEEHFRPGGN